MQPSGTLTLEEYRMLPETEPATEYVEREMRQKLVPKRAHSTLQKRKSHTHTGIRPPSLPIFGETST